MKFILKIFTTWDPKDFHHSLKGRYSEHTFRTLHICSRIPVLGKGHNKYPRREAGQEATFICYTVLSFPSFLWQTLLAPQYLFSPSSILIVSPHPRIRYICQPPLPPGVCSHKHVTGFWLAGCKQRCHVWFLESIRKGREVCVSFLLPTGWITT